MATTNTSKAQQAKKAAPAATATAAPAATAAPVAAPQPPHYTMGPWPVKAQGGNSIRAYCYTVAKALAKAQGAQGFTVAQLASAFAGNAAGTTYRQPSGGWGTVAKPNGIAMQHANWFAHAKQGWLTPVAQG